MGGSKMFLHVGAQVSVEDLLRGIIVQSGNDACITLAEGMAGEEALFVQHMNAAATELGLQHSSFKNSTGWPDDEHKMSMRDLAILTKTLVNSFPEYYYYFAELTFTYNDISQNNRNTLLGKNGVDGLKTGHTDLGGYGIVVSAKHAERRLIAVVNGARNHTERVTEADRLLIYGFNNFTQHTIFKAHEALHEIPVLHGNKDTVTATILTDINLLLPRMLDPKTLRAELEYDAPIIAPVPQGQRVGTLNIKQNDRVIWSGPIVTADEVRLGSFWRRFIQNLKTI
jgi:D-alanyl-D-alanine carboxypeptidase (penicillin-binding protein 5/6)